MSVDVSDRVSERRTDLSWRKTAKYEDTTFVTSDVIERLESTINPKKRRKETEETV